MQKISELYRASRDPEKLKIWFQQNAAFLVAWSTFLVVVVALFFLFSDGDFSFLMTLSSLVGMFSFLMVAIKIESCKSCSGVSLKMIECYVILIFARLCSIIPFEGYLPYDRSGDWLYQTVEALTLCFAGSIAYMCRIRYKETYDPSTDTVNHLLLIVPSLILSLIFHPSLNLFPPADVSWTFALYLESVCVLPQLFMFQKEGKPEPFTTHFLAGQALSKALSFAFWISSYSELNGPASSLLKSYVGVWVIVMQVVQLIVMGDFIYHYLRCLSKGVPVQYILMENV
eukprot:GHVQ01031838.1.p1 GENE.GHVQ01031838.1~~GHVQ01031838.1.p1  ORF type:complete len:286 (+),score=18.95 GHVQ01031838.1:672-1529(+)